AMGDANFWHPTNGAFYAWVMDTSNPHGTNETDYNPSWTTNLLTSWQANDPLVHYTIGDLTDTKQDPNPGKRAFPQLTLNHHYQPWDGDPNFKDSGKNVLTSAAKKDPYITSSDSWLFLTNKFPNLGWLGRVHRGTPWQTVYMKSPAIALKDWMTWS